jgi:DNA-binding transcriptional MerR regulator
MLVNDRTWKVGELSKLTGLTIRTLHHYDEIGLVSPRFRTESGHRLYTEEDIIKLQQIMSLKELDLSLEEIEGFFKNPDYSPKEVLELQIERLNQEIKLKEELKVQLQELWEVFNSWKKPTLEQFISSIELIKNQKKYFTEEQRSRMKKYYVRLSDAEVNELAVNWSQIVTKLQGEMDKGTPIDDPAVIELAKEWQQGINLFTGGDAGIIKSAERYYADNPQAAMVSGMSGELYKYITEILANLKLD